MNLESTLKEINKEFGEGSVMALSDKKHDYDVISSGSLKLNRAMGTGGWVKGRIYEIYGPESSGKTTLAIHALAETQAAKGRAVIIDTEHSFDSDYASSIGVNVDNLLISQPDYGEQALEIADRLISTGEIDIVVIDSVAQLVPKVEIEGGMGESKMGVQARLMSQALRKLTATVSKHNVILIFINQLREKIGVMFGSPETTTGGNALKFYASMRLDIRRISINKEGDEAVSNKVRVKVLKNKLAPPFKNVEFDLIYGIGIDKIGEILDLAIEANIIKKGGAWLTYGETKVHGLDKFRELLNDNEEFRTEIENKVKQYLNDKKI